METTRRNFLASSLSASFAFQTQRPNIVLVVSDQQHWQACGFKNPFFQTPAMDRLAREAAVFENSFCTTPQCSPSRASILTGLYPVATGVLGNMDMTGGKPLAMSTFAPMLQKAGYATAYFGKWHLGSDPAGNAGWDEEFKKERDSGATRRALEFLDRRQSSRQPFALVISYLNPHDIYQYRPGLRRPDSATPLPPTCRPDALRRKPAPQQFFMTSDQGQRINGQPRSEYQAYRELYREKVRLFDYELNKILEALDESNLAASTLLIVTSDHGDMDAHHGLIWKGPFMYEQVIRVPLLVRGPGISPRRIRDHHAVNVDVAPTLLDFAGSSVGRTHGVSLKPLLHNASGFHPRQTVIGQYHGKQKWTEPIRMIRTPEWKYTIYRNGGEELYDLANDIFEQENLAARSRHYQRKRTLRQQLDNWMKAKSDDFYLRKAQPPEP